MLKVLARSIAAALLAITVCFLVALLTGFLMSDNIVSEPFPMAVAASVVALISTFLLGLPVHFVFLKFKVTHILFYLIAGCVGSVPWILSFSYIDSALLMSLPLVAFGLLVSGVFWLGYYKVLKG